MSIAPARFRASVAFDTAVLGLDAAVPIGNTAMVESDTAANITELRPIDMPPFSLHDVRDGGGEHLRHTYGMTKSEVRPARALVDGASLRQAARRSGITYTTARGYMKTLFQKTGSHHHSQLIDRRLRDTPMAH